MQLRQQIEFSRKLGFDKLHERQENVRKHQLETLEKRRLKLK